DKSPVANLVRGENRSVEPLSAGSDAALPVLHNHILTVRRDDPRTHRPLGRSRLKRVPCGGPTGCAERMVDDRRLAADDPAVRQARCVVELDLIVVQVQETAY